MSCVKTGSKTIRFFFMICVALSMFSAKQALAYCATGTVCSGGSDCHSEVFCFDDGSTGDGSGGTSGGGQNGGQPGGGGSGDGNIATIPITIDGTQVYVSPNLNNVRTTAISCSDEVDVISRYANAVDALHPGFPTPMGWTVGVNMYGSHWSFRKICQTCSGVARWAPQGTCHTD